MLAVEIYFRDANGNIVGGELVNHYEVVDIDNACIGLAIDQIRDDEVDVLVHANNEMQFHRIPLSSVVSAEQVLV